MIHNVKRIAAVSRAALNAVVMHHPGLPFYRRHLKQVERPAADFRRFLLFSANASLPSSSF